MPPKRPIRGGRESGCGDAGARTPPPAPDSFKLPVEEYARYGIPAAGHARVATKRCCVQLGLEAFHIVERYIPGVDDPVYEKSREVWEAVPRGWASVFSLGADGGARLVATLAGARKFGYPGSPYGERDQVATVVGIDKENGECGHLAAFVHKGVPYWIVGSKHVHVVVRALFSAGGAAAAAAERQRMLEADLASYGDDSVRRFSVARKIARLWLAHCANGTLERTKDVQAMHAELAASGLTACFEAIFSDSQHIVDYGGKTTLRFFALSRNAPSATAGLVEHWSATAAFCERFGLPCAAMTEEMPADGPEFVAFRDAVARRQNSEGVVVYGADHTGRVCCMWKEKAYPYVMERVTREAIKRGVTGAALRSLLALRLRQQDPTVREHFSEWESSRMEQLIAFASWLHYKRLWTTDEWSLSTRWLTLQHQFFEAPAEEREEAVKGNWGGPQRVQCEVVICVGPPGSGKSTLSRTLYALLQQAGKNPRWINQDESGSRVRYLSNAVSAASDPATTHLILDKVNVGLGNRADYQKEGLEPSVTILFHHPDGVDALREVCVSRVVARGDMHRTLRVQDGERHVAEKIFNDIMSAYDPPDDDSVVPVDVCSPFEETLRAVWKALGERTTDTSFPAIDSLDVRTALQRARDYESLLAQYGTSSQQFAALKILTPMEPVIARLVPSGALANKAVRPGFHVTLRFFGGVMDPIWFAEVASQVGQIVPIRVSEVVFDNSGVAFVVGGSFRCANAVPHVTIACASGVQPSYSNQLVAKAEDVTRITVDPPLELEAEVALM